MKGSKLNMPLSVPGNYNENTARIYTDLFLLTARPEITREVAKTFQFIENRFEVGKYRYLMIAPINLRARLKSLINREIKFAKEKKKAEIFIKVNNLVDKEIVRKLYDASNAGVKIRLMVRGACSLVPGIEGQSEHIEAISILDRFLEHPRVFMFRNNGKEEVFMGSADIMERNLDHRIEVVTQILDKDICRMLKEILELQWRDNQKARTLVQGHLNEYLQPGPGEKAIRSQMALYAYFEKQTLAERLHIKPTVG